jgi:hypothetical protein
MYSMAAFGPVLGFLLGAYLLSFHMDSFGNNVISIGEFTIFAWKVTSIFVFLFGTLEGA